MDGKQGGTGRMTTTTLTKRKRQQKSVDVNHGQNAARCESYTTVYLFPGRPVSLESDSTMHHQLVNAFAAHNRHFLGKVEYQLCLNTYENDLLQQPPAASSYV